MKKIFALLLVAIFLFSGIASARPTAKITVKAINEQGEVIEGAKVTVGFVIPNSTGIGTSEIHKKGQTNNKGEFSASSGSMHLLGFSVDKDGYYQNGDGYEFTSHSLLLNRWEPWNPTIEVVLKKKRNPVAMYIGGTNWVEVPALEKPVGYDLEKGDWVAPYGTGEINDFYLTCHSNVRAYADYDVSIELSFADTQNGIQEYFFDNNDQSYYKWPFTAPSDGYKSTLHKELRKQFPGKGITTNAIRDVNYLFRVRSKVDEHGNLISANYGKIPGEIGFDAGNNGGCTFSIHYYFNPDGTPNLEEDPEKNLFKKK